MKQKAIAAGEFKNSCLKIMDSVHKSGIPITVTKRGKPLVRVVPVREAEARKTLLGVIVYEAADLFSTGERWEAES
jgi:prevent-host-death family protein